MPKVATRRAQDAMSDPLCRRLQLLDLLLSVFQRITKYPLLLMALSKQTACLAGTEGELERLRTAEGRTRDLLAHVNHEIRMWENQHFLEHVLKKCVQIHLKQSLCLATPLIICNHSYH